MLSLMDEFEADADNRCWASFLDRISRAPHQVLRYVSMGFTGCNCITVIFHFEVNFNFE